MVAAAGCLPAPGGPHLKWPGGGGVVGDSGRGFAERQHGALVLGESADGQDRAAEDRCLTAPRPSRPPCSPVPEGRGAVHVRASYAGTTAPCLEGVLRPPRRSAHPVESTLPAAATRKRQSRDCLWRAGAAPVAGLSGSGIRVTRCLG